MVELMNQENSEFQRGWFGSLWNRSPGQATEETSIAQSERTTVPEVEDPTDHPELPIEQPDLDPTTEEHWYQRMYHTLFRTNTERMYKLKVDETTRYSQLDLDQINYLETEALEVINSYSNSWCWFEDMSDINVIDNDDSHDSNHWRQRPGVVSVFGTGCGKCPFPLNKPPVNVYPGYHVYIKNSVLLPSFATKDYFHPLPLRTKIANTVKEHYNYPNEKHLYMKKHIINPKELKRLKESKEVVHKRHLIISVVGWLPDKYEKLSLGEQRTAQYLSQKVAKSLKSNNSSLNNDLASQIDNEIVSLSFECPLHTKDLQTVLDECMTLLKHWEDIFYNIDSIYFVGVYHSVPLLIDLCYNILHEHEKYGIDLQTTKLGMLTFDSCLEGYRFWDHSVDRSTYKEKDDEGTNSNRKENLRQDNENGNIYAPVTDQEYLKLEQAKEKQLYYGLNNNEITLLSKFKNYHNLESEESKHVQNRLDWLLYNCDTFRLNMVSTLYDNFMTITQKLAIDFNHPKIVRNIWCDGRFLDIDLQRPEKFNVPNFNIKTPNFQFELNIPKDRKFEIVLLNLLLLTQNLGYEEFIPIIKMISPYFISRSFNENTIAPTVKKQRNNQLKVWLQEMEQHWSILDNENTDLSSKRILPPGVSDVHDFLRYVNYQTIKDPSLLQLYGEIYDDDSIYSNFIDITTLTRNPTHKRHLKLSHNKTNSEKDSILDTQNQYDLVWKFHECLCNFIHLKNLPIQDPIQHLDLAVMLETPPQSYYNGTIIHNNNVTFERDSEESVRRIQQLWESYQTWDPQTRGLANLKRIVSILATYDTFSELLQEIVD